MFELETVSLGDAQRIIAAGIARAREIGQPQNVAVIVGFVILNVWLISEAAIV